MLKTVKSWFPERVKGPILAATRPRVDAELEQYRDAPKVVVMLAGFYQNLGDMALTYAQKRFIERTLPDHRVVLLPSTDTYLRMKALRSVVQPGDVITTIAGGNMDDLYVSLEDARRYVVRSFPDHAVISFPQTMAFSKTPEGLKRLRRSQKTYSRHPNLTIYGREPESYARMKGAFPETPIGYCPDIVLSLDLENPPVERTGVFVCIRRDRESKLTQHERDAVSGALLAHHDDVTFGDTVDVTLEECTPQAYEATLERFWDMLRRREVVVTDRLHCMIFCAITGTPCVVLSNSNHKIEGVYRAWLKDLPFITFLDRLEIDELLAAVDRMKGVDVTGLTPVGWSDEFDSLRDALRNAAAF